jgi:hypothetical protein
MMDNGITECCQMQYWRQRRGGGGFDPGSHTSCMVNAKYVETN